MPASRFTFTTATITPAQHAALSKLAEYHNAPISADLLFKPAPFGLLTFADTHAIATLR
jgi:hypothetical protein